MNMFLLDPEARLLAGFIWISRSNSIALYVPFSGQGRILTHPLYRRQIQQIGLVSCVMAPL